VAATLCVGRIDDDLRVAPYGPPVPRVQKSPALRRCLDVVLQAEGSGLVRDARRGRRLRDDARIDPLTVAQLHDRLPAAVRRDAERAGRQERLAAAREEVEIGVRIARHDAVDELPLRARAAELGLLHGRGRRRQRRRGVVEELMGAGDPGQGDDDARRERDGARSCKKSHAGENAPPCHFWRRTTSRVCRR
jgi:hypothetical protein